MKLGVVIPALDEEDAVGNVVSRVLRTASPMASARVVVADNGSTDQTVMAARAAGAEIVSVKRRGYGSACLGAIRYLAEWPDVLVFIDADGSSLPEEIPRLVEPVASREVELSLGARPFTSAMSPPQRFGTRLAVRLVNLRWRTDYSDMGPFRCIRFEAYRQLGMRDTTWGWTIEMQILAAIKGLPTVEVPVSWEDRLAGVSKISGTVSGVVRAGSRILWTVGRYALLDQGPKVPD